MRKEGYNANVFSALQDSSKQNELFEDLSKEIALQQEKEAGKV